MPAPAVELIDVSTASYNELCILRIEEVSSGNLAKDNGAAIPVNFYFIDIGTIVCRDSNEDWRPFASTTVLRVLITGIGHHHQAVDRAHVQCAALDAGDEGGGGTG